MKLNNEQLNKIEERLEHYEGEDKMISSIELAEIMKSEPIPIVQKTGLPYLDKILNGVEGGELVIVSGPTGHGKTTLLMSITKNMIKAGIKSSWFTLEVSPRNFIRKISQGGECPLFYLPSKNTENQITWLLERIIEGCVKYNTRVVFIDHLHQIFSIERMRGNLSLEIGDVVAQIKQLAIEYGLIIFLIAHCTDNKISVSYEPTIRDIRDSGLISRLADIVIGVWRIKHCDTKEELFKTKVADNYDENDNWAKVRVWKNRREGTLGTLFVEHSNHLFYELDINTLQKSNYEQLTDTKINEELGF